MEKPNHKKDLSVSLHLQGSQMNVDASGKETLGISLQQPSDNQEHWVSLVQLVSMSWEIKTELQDNFQNGLSLQVPKHPFPRLQHLVCKLPDAELFRDPFPASEKPPWAPISYSDISCHGWYRRVYVKWINSIPHSSTRMGVHTHKHVCTHTNTHTHMPIYTCMYSTPYIMLTQHTRAHTHAHTNTYTLTHKCTHRCLHPHFACIYLVTEKSTLYWDTKKQSLIFKKPRVTNNKENI